MLEDAQEPLPINLPQASQSVAGPHRYISMISLHVRTRFKYRLRERSASRWSLTSGPTLGPGEDFPQRGTVGDKAMSQPDFRRDGDSPISRRS
jgi:hypothetical protein